MRDETERKEEYFDSANIAESYSGIVLPLTCSFAKMVYARVYRDLLAHSGVSKKILDAHSEVFENLLGFFYGRMYYNMNNWYAMAEFVPGYRRNKENFESMISSNVTQHRRSGVRPSLPFSLLYPWIVAGKVLLFDRTCAQFKATVEARLRELRTHAFDALSYGECIRLLNDINKDLLHRWYITVENDFFVMTYLGILKKMLSEKELQKAITFPSKATEQVGALVDLSAHMAVNPAVWAAIERDDVGAFTAGLRENPALGAKLGSYLETFGGRFANELKLESVGVDEDTGKLFSVLRNYRSYTPRAPASGQKGEPSLTKKILTRFALSGFKKYASRREEFRLLRSNTFGMARRLFRRMGDILVENGGLENAEDIFYLRTEEILSAGAAHTDFREIVRMRKNEYESYSSVTPPTHFKTKDGAIPVPEKNVVPARELIQARPASSGVVLGTVRIFKQFSMPEKIDFDILVTSHTDPGWTSLMALSKGLIIEHGGVLSHASIVARELGIPAVIGAEHATDILKDGQTVRIDGTAGTIQLQ